MVVRRQLYEKGKEAVQAARDPLIEVAQIVDAEARELRKIMEAQSEIKQQAQAQIGKARFAKEGTSQYPDATFTLRLAFGVVKGYEEDGKQVPFETVYEGLYQRAAEHKISRPLICGEMVKRKSKLNLNAAELYLLADIIGGSSGPSSKCAESLLGLFRWEFQSWRILLPEKQGRRWRCIRRGLLRR